MILEVAEQTYIKRIKKPANNNKTTFDTELNLRDDETRIAFSLYIHIHCFNKLDHCVNICISSSRSNLAMVGPIDKIFKFLSCSSYYKQRIVKTIKCKNYPVIQLHFCPSDYLMLICFIILRLCY